MTKLAAQDFEDLLQVSIHCIDMRQVSNYSNLFLVLNARL